VFKCAHVLNVFHISVNEGAHCNIVAVGIALAPLDPRAFTWLCLPLIVISMYLITVPRGTSLGRAVSIPAA
jgi:hypothetical protein